MPTAAEPLAGKRRQIVETAYRLFKRYGFHATGIDRIIGEAQVAKMTMYRHFPAKDDLILAVLDWRAKRFARRLERLAAQAQTPEQKIAALFDWYGDWFAGPDFHGCVFAHALAEFGDPAHPVFKAATRQKDELEAHMRGVLEASIPAARAQGLATTLLMLVEGATLVAQTGRGPAAIGEARRAALALIAAPVQA